MGIRRINYIDEDNNNIIKIVKESNNMYKNEKYAYSLLKENIPRFIECDDNTNTIIIEKIKGKTLKEVEITDEIVEKLANAIKKIHSHIRDGKVFVHGDLHKENILYYNDGIYFIDFCCSRYDIPEVDYSALEIHVLDTKEKIELFYNILGVNPDKELLKKEKVKHCLSHLTWATTDKFKSINMKSKKIIEENDDLLKENDFDYLGLIKLNNSENIENLVIKINDGLFVSRSNKYYAKKTYNELVNFRENLKKLFPLEIKKAFVVCEYMLNASYRVFYEDYKRALNGEINNIDVSQKCMEEDVKNIIECLRNKVIDTPRSSLQKTDNDVYVENRLIEGDHKMLLYKTISNIHDANHIVCPLYSAILIGPFFKILHGTDYSYVKFGIHDQNMKQLYDEGKITLNNITINNSFPSNIEIFDANIGTGQTLIILKEIFTKNNMNVKTGTLEISYEYMDRNKDFWVLENIDYKTYVSTRHHTITDDLVCTLCNNHKDYIKKLRSYGFQNQFLDDIELLYNRGKSICQMNNISFDSLVEYDSNFVLSMDIMNKKIRYLEKYPIQKAISIIRDYPKVNIIDLDRFYGESQSLEIIREIMKIKKVRVGGGIRKKEEIQKLLDMGAEKVIIGTHATPDLLKDFEPEKIIVGLDSIDRRTNTVVNIPEKIKLFEPYCSEFNYVSVEHDGKASGGDVDNAIKYSKLTKKIFNCVGGISTKEEMETLRKHNVGCTIGRKLQEGYFE